MLEVLTRKESIRLKNGEELQTGVVEDQMPKELMRQLQYLLVAKAPQYYVHFDEYVANGEDGTEEGLEWRFYLGFLNDTLMANICTWEYNGIGILGHVYTSESVRGKGAATALMVRVQEDFKERGGRAMQLNTGHGSVAHRIYSRCGYKDMPQSPGSMLHETYPGASAGLFDRGKASIANLRWCHWPTLNLLTLNRGGEYIRSVAMGMYGPHTSEGTLIAVRARQAKGKVPGSVMKVLRDAEETAMGFGTVLPDPHFGGNGTYQVLDLFIHPNWRDREAELAEATAGGSKDGLLCYRSEPAEWLSTLGFTHTGDIPGAANGQDVMVWMRPPASTK